jgi:hypothetical protein
MIRFANLTALRKEIKADTDPSLALASSVSSSETLSNFLAGYYLIKIPETVCN